MRRFLLAALAAIWLLNACAPSVTLLTRPPQASPTASAHPVTTTPSPAPERTPSPSPTTGVRLNPETVRGVQTEAWFSGEVAFLAQMAADFNAVNPWGVQVSAVPHPNLNRLAQAVALALESHSPPGLVVALPEQLAGWRPALLDLTPYAAHPQWGVLQADILPAFQAASRLQDAQTGLPLLRSGRYLFYNVSWARELGFENAPRTWEDFRAQACAANAAWKRDADPTNDGFGGLALETFPDWQTPYGWIRAAGGAVTDEGRFHFASEPNAMALTRLVELREAGCAWLPASLTNYENLATRRALFISGSLSEIPAQRAAFAAANSADEWTVLAFPGETPAVPVYGLDAALFRTDERRQLAAWLFLRWLSEPEQQARLARSTGWLPVSRAAFDWLAGDFAANPQKGSAQALLADAVSAPSLPGWDVASKVLADGFVSLFRAFPAVSAQETLEQMDAVVNDLLK